MAGKQNIYIKMYVTHRNTTIQIPVNPSEVTVTMNNLNDTTEIVDIGEIMQLRGMGLTSISFDSFIPDTATHHYVNIDPAQYRGMQYYLDFFSKIYSYKDIIDKLLRPDDGICKLVITDTRHPEQSIVLRSSITRFDQVLVGLDPDRHYSITFTEWVPYGAQVLTIANIVDGVAHLKVTSSGASLL